VAVPNMGHDVLDVAGRLLEHLGPGSFSIRDVAAAGAAVGVPGVLAVATLLGADAAKVSGGRVVIRADAQNALVLERVMG
jgi:hypothetical protein